MKDILRTLVALPTVSSNKAANHQALDYIQDYLKKRGMFVTRHEWNGVGSLVATTQQTKSPRILLAAHVDVVPAPPQAFELTEEDGKLFGAGICDMKFAIASYLQLVDELQGNLQNYDFGIMIMTDEEIGGKDGAKMLLSEAGYRTDVCVLPDGGNDWGLEVAAKGLIWVTATATGKTAHGSRPWEGENAINKMLLFLTALQRDLFAEQGPDTSTCTINTIKGGIVPNQLPDLCQADIDIRPIDPEAQTHIWARTKELAAQYDITLEAHLNDAAINLDLSNPYVISFIQHIERVRKMPVHTVRSNGGSDARYFAEYGIPSLVTYPTGGERHGGREWIEEKSFYQFYDVLRGFIADTAITKTTNPTEVLTLAP